MADPRGENARDQESRVEKFGDFPVCGGNQPSEMQNAPGAKPRIPCSYFADWV